jgi:lipopolysaccharide transport system permease protein
MISTIREVKPVEEDGALRVRLRVEIEELDASDGRPVLGWQVLDADSGAYLREGEHRVLDRVQEDCLSAPEEIVLTAETLPHGPSRVVVSVLGARGWRYRAGDRYLWLDVERTNAKLRLVGWKISAQSMEWLPALLRALRRAFTLPVLTIARHHSLIRTMVWRDLLGRYRGSFAGVFWSALNPLLLMATYYFVFGVVLQARFGGDPSREGFVLYFLAGMLPWLPFSEALGRAPGVLLEHATFIKKLVFPVETLPINLVVSGLVTQGFAIVLFLGGLLLFRGAVPAAAVWLPVLLVPQVMLTLGCCWLFSALGLLFRDLAQVMGFLLTVGFFLTPICYPEESLPEAVRPVLALNPFLHLVRAFRDVLLEGQAPETAPFLWLCGVAALVFLGGYTVFHKLRRSFADLL